MAIELKEIPLLAEFDEEDRAALAELLVDRRIEAGRSLFREGDEAAALVFVVEGGFKVESRRTGTLGFVGPGAWFGGASLVSLGNRETTVKAHEDSSVRQLDRLAFRRLVQDAPHAACRLLEAIAADLADAVRPLLDRVVDQRAADP